MPGVTIDATALASVIAGLREATGVGLQGAEIDAFREPDEPDEPEELASPPPSAVEPPPPSTSWAPPSPSAPLLAPSQPPAFPPDNGTNSSDDRFGNYTTYANTTTTATTTTTTTTTTTSAAATAAATSSGRVPMPPRRRRRLQAADGGGSGACNVSRTVSTSTIVTTVITTTSSEVVSYLQSPEAMAALAITRVITNSAGQSLSACEVLSVQVADVIVPAPSPPPPSPPLPPLAPINVTVDTTAQAVESITTVVATTVSLAVTASVGGSVMAAVGASTSMAVGGAAAGAAGGGAAGGASSAGSSAGGVFPLIFGVQRLSLSSGLACDQSEVTTGVADSMSWSTGYLPSAGYLGLFSSDDMAAAEAADEAMQPQPQPPTTARRVRRRLHALVRQASRRLNFEEEESYEEQAAAAADAQAASGSISPYPLPMLLLVDQVTTFAIALSVVMSGWSIGFCCYKYRCNRRYYARMRQLQQDRPPSTEEQAAKQAAAFQKRRFTRIFSKRSLRHRKLPARIAPEPQGRCMISPPPSPSAAEPAEAVPKPAAGTHTRISPSPVGNHIQMASPPPARSTACFDMIGETADSPSAPCSPPMMLPGAPAEYTPVIEFGSSNAVELEYLEPFGDEADWDEVSTQELVAPPRRTMVRSLTSRLPPEYFERMEAASKLQKWRRSQKARQKARQFLALIKLTKLQAEQQLRAATRIQSVYRSRVGRQRFAAVIEAIRRDEAARMLQKNYQIYQRRAENSARWSSPASALAVAAAVEDDVRVKGVRFEDGSKPLAPAAAQAPAAAPAAPRFLDPSAPRPKIVFVPLDKDANMLSGVTLGPPPRVGGWLWSRVWDRHVTLGAMVTTVAPRSPLSDIINVGEMVVSLDNETIYDYRAAQKKLDQAEHAVLRVTRPSHLGPPPLSRATSSRGSRLHHSGEASSSYHLLEDQGRAATKLQAMKRGKDARARAAAIRAGAGASTSDAGGAGGGEGGSARSLGQGGCARSLGQSDSAKPLHRRKSGRKRRRAVKVVVAEVLEDVDVELPPFRRLPPYFVFPNLPLLPFWFFNAGLVKLATALLAWQWKHEWGRSSAGGNSTSTGGGSLSGELGSAEAASSDGGSGEEAGSGDLSTASGAPQECGRFCTALALGTLLMVLAVLATGLAMIRNWWLFFAKNVWVPGKPANQPKDVPDPLFRLYSTIKTRVGRCMLTPPRCPSDKEVHETFIKYDRDGSGAMDVAELAEALHDLGVFPPEALQDAHASTLGSCSQLPLSESARANTLSRTSLASRTSGRETERDVELGRSTSLGQMSQRRRSEPRLKARRLRQAQTILRAYDQKQTNGKLEESEFKEVLVKVISKMELLHPQQRMRGKWALPAEFGAEPQRTERLVVHPFRMLHANAVDAKDSMSFHLFGKTAGQSFLGMCFAWGSMAVQVALGIVSGLKPALTTGSTAATVQVLFIAFAKLGWAGVLLHYAPCLCLLTNSVVVTQFVLEGINVLMTFIAAQDGVSQETGSVLTELPLYLILVPVFLPVIQKCYDSIFVNIIVNCSSKKFNPRAALVAGTIFVLSIPAFLMKAFGMATGAQHFNAAKLSSSAKAAIESTKARAKGQIVTVTRVVRRRVDANGNILAPGESLGQHRDDDDDDNEDEGPGGEGDADADECDGGDDGGGD